MTETSGPVIWSSNGANPGRIVHLFVGQRRQDRQRRIGGLATSGCAWRRDPGRDRLVGKPHRQAAALTQAGLVGGPVRDFVLLPWDVVAAILV
jgi:hypothetical protein